MEPNSYLKAVVFEQTKKNQNMGQIIFHIFSKAVDELKDSRGVCRHTSVWAVYKFSIDSFFFEKSVVYEKNKNFCKCENIFPNKKENSINQLVNLQPN